MDGALVPSGLWLMTPTWLNHFENVLTVQFQHRVTGYLVVGLALLLAFAVARSARAGHLKGAAHAAAACLVAQMLIGIATLVGQIPFGLALAHQGFAVIVLAVVVEVWSRARFREPVAA
jgi:cytochrome c oxidase assembly protein subunit 15